MSNPLIVRSYTKGVDQSNRKVDLVPKRAAMPVIKAINSAKANAINNHNLDGKSLTIATISVTTGDRIKRFKPASRGRALPFEKKSSNILVELTGALKAKKVVSTDKATTTVKSTVKKESK